MPPNRLSDYRIAAGIRTVTYMNDSAIALRNFPRQNNQGMADWTAPDTSIFIVPQRPIDTALSGKVVSHGFYEWQWVFGYWTVGMWSYFRTNILAGANQADVTVKAYSSAETAIYLTAILRNPELVGGLQNLPSGYRVTLSFAYGEIIT